MARRSCGQASYTYAARRHCNHVCDLFSRYVTTVPQPPTHHGAALLGVVAMGDTDGWHFVPKVQRHAVPSESAKIRWSGSRSLCWGLLRIQLRFYKNPQPMKLTSNPSNCQQSNSLNNESHLAHELRPTDRGISEAKSTSTKLPSNL